MLCKLTLVAWMTLSAVSAQNAKGRSCDEMMEPSMTWNQFCQKVLNRECILDSNSEPKCDKCSAGFQDIGSADCLPVGGKCANQGAPEKGTLIGVCQGAGPNDMCYFRCDPGHRLEGPPALICRKDLTWDDQPPKCTATLKCEDVVEGTEDTWISLCSKGKNMKCQDNLNDDPECVCKDGFQFDDLGACVAV